MSFLSEDPTYLLLLLGLPAVGFLIATKVTQDGRQLIRAGVLGGLMVLVAIVEYFWVTDNERVEQTVYDLGVAVAASDVERVESFLAPDVTLNERGTTLGEGVAIANRLEGLRDVAFDYLRISQVEAHANPQSRTGSATFRVMASGTVKLGIGDQNFGTVSSEWSLGFREMNGRWKVTRISPVKIPPQANPMYLFRPRPAAARPAGDRPARGWTTCPNTSGNSHRRRRGDPAGRHGPGKGVVESSRVELGRVGPGRVRGGSESIW